MLMCEIGMGPLQILISQLYRFGTSFEIMRDGDIKHEYETVANGL